MKHARPSSLPIRPFASIAAVMAAVVSVAIATTSPPAAARDTEGRSCSEDPWRSQYVPDTFSPENSSQTVEFFRACQRHDLCYTSLGAVQNRCDVALFNWLELSCERAFPDEREVLIACYQAAKGFFESLADSDDRPRAFTEAQQRARDNLEREIYRIYEEIVSEVATQEAVRPYVAAIWGGIELERVRENIARSDAARGAIEQTYREVLGRSPRRREFDRFVRGLGAGSALNDLRRELARSGETLAVLNQIYREILDRDIDPSGIETWTKALGKGWTLSSVREAIANSEEAQNRKSDSKVPNRSHPILSTGFDLRTRTKVRH